jgi:thioredoxin-like negative regulator of GroEL
MFSSRNIHFAILGIILGASTGYIFAFYQVQSSIPRELPSSQSSNMPQGHPNVNEEQLGAMVQDALAKNPKDTTLMIRYASFLFDRQRYTEAVDWLQKAVTIFLDQRNVAAAEQVIKQIEMIDPKYAGLEPLKKRLAGIK